MWKILITIFCFLLFVVSCGGSEDEEELTTDTKLSEMSTDLLFDMCEDLIEIAPTSCFQPPDNYWKLSAKVSGVPSVEMQYCLDELTGYETTLAVRDLRKCYQEADRDCNIDNEVCPLADSDNNSENSQGHSDETCVEDLKCNEWINSSLCLALCFVMD